MTKNILWSLLLSLGCATTADRQPAPPPPTPVYDRPIRASFYARKFEGRMMANGHRYRGAGVSAASLRYPLGSVLLVKSQATGKEIQVTVTDRGPWSTKFSLDLSPEAFRQLGFTQKQGWGWVSIRRIA